MRHISVLLLLPCVLANLSGCSRNTETVNAAFASAAEKPSEDPVEHFNRIISLLRKAEFDSAYALSWLGRILESGDERLEHFDSLLANRG